MKIFSDYLEKKCKIINALNFNEKEKTVTLRNNLNKYDRSKILKRFFDIDNTDKENFTKKEEDKSSLKDIFPNLNLNVENTVFKEFIRLYDLFTDYANIPLDLGAYQTALINWLREYIKLNEKGKKQIQPYIHIFVFHVVELLIIHGDIHKFTGQGLEKMLDNIKHHYRLSIFKRYDTHQIDGCIAQLMNFINRRDLDNLGVKSAEIIEKVYQRPSSAI